MKESKYEKRQSQLADKLKEETANKDQHSGIQVDDPFYASRGIYLKGVEVRSVQCKDKRTQDTLQDIIQEQTHRINRLAKQESENEVNLRKLQGQIESTKLEGQLLDLRKDQKEKEGMTAGLAEAARIRAFFDSLSEVVPDAGDRMALFNTLRKGEALEHLSKGQSVSMFFTPSDVDLKINASSAHSGIVSRK